MKLRPIVITFLLALVAAFLGATAGADFFWRAATGLDPTAFPAGQSLQSVGEMFLPGLDVSLAGVVLGLGTVLIVPVVAFFVLRSQRRARIEEADPGRRNFLSGSLAGGGAAIATLVAGGGAMVGRSFYGLGHKDGRGWKGPLTEVFGGKVQKTHPEWKDEWRGSRIQSYGRLGRTDWPVSDTVLGTGPIRGELGTKIVRLALERGVNYIDTAPDYSAEGSERAVGEAIRDVPRESIFLATKWCTPIGHLPAGTPVDVYKKAG